MNEAALAELRRLARTEGFRVHGQTLLNLLDLIDSLTKERDEARRLFGEAMELVGEYEAQCGGDYFAEKWKLKERAAEIRAGMKDQSP